MTTFSNPLFMPALPNGIPGWNSVLTFEGADSGLFTFTKTFVLEF